MIVRSFSESLAASHAAEDLPLWKETYQKAFPDMVAMINHRQDGPHQRAGIDRSIILSTSKQILVDEKVRGRNKITNKVYEDIALEFLSSTERNQPGWVCKLLLADWIAYAIAPIGKCYLLPVQQLQTAWQTNYQQWFREHRTIRVPNTSWTTQCLCVPVDVLFPAIGKCLRVDFTPVEID